ncbi:MAG: 3-oxoacyl-ACP reductase, partial [Candidatus Rokuibacteriota bacterium]
MSAIGNVGRAIALALADRGWSVAVCYRTSRQDAEEAEELLRRRRVRAHAIQADVSDPDAAQKLVRDVERQWGRIDALVNCAGPYHRRPLLEETVEGWREMFDNNLHPVFYLSQAVAAGMRARRWGRILTFGMANADQMVGQTEVTA